MTTRVHAVTSNNANVTMFPNGALFDAAGGTDVFLGSLYLDYITISTTGASAQNITINIYDGVNRTHANAALIGHPVVGGTGTAGVIGIDRWRVISGVQAVNEQGEPYSLTAPGTQITNLRKIMDAKVIAIPAGAAGPAAWRVDVGQRIPGCVVHFAGGTTANTYAIHYKAHTGGAARRRLFYRPGSTVKVMPPLVGEASL